MPDPHERTRLYAARGVAELFGVFLAITGLHFIENATEPARTAPLVALCLGGVATLGSLVAGIALSQKTWSAAQEHLGFEEADVDEYCIHQVSQRHAEQLAANLNVDLEKALLIVGQFGNIGPASVPIVLSKALDLGRIQRGDRVVLAGIGSGLNCTVGEVIW